MDNYNVNRKVATFGDFTNNIESEKEELKKVKRSFMPNSSKQNFVDNVKTKYNKVTHKLDTDLTQNDIKDRLDAIDDLEEVEESVTDQSEKPTETSPDYEKHVWMYENDEKYRNDFNDAVERMLKNKESSEDRFSAYQKLQRRLGQPYSLPGNRDSNSVERSSRPLRPGPKK